LSDVLQNAAAVFGLEQMPNSGGHPQTDGLVERLNQMLKSMFTKLVNKKGSGWDTNLGPVLMAYRTTPQSSTGCHHFICCMDEMPRYHQHWIFMSLSHWL